jgi:hypothetical protein
MKWEVLLYAFDRGISIDEAITELAAEVVDFFEAIL